MSVEAWTQVISSSDFTCSASLSFGKLFFSVFAIAQVVKVSQHPCTLVSILQLRPWWETASKLGQNSPQIEMTTSKLRLIEACRNY